MKQIFGTSFLTLYGDVPNSFWLSKIAELSDDEVAEGLKRVAEMNRDYPVNLTEFAEACKPKSAGRRYLGTPTTPKAMRLEKPLAEREHIDRCLANMRKLFGRTREPGEDDEIAERPKPRLDNACSCPLDQPGTCDVCRAWSERLNEMEATEQPLPPPDEAT